MGKYDFNTLVDRGSFKARKWNMTQLKEDGTFGENIIPMGMADMDFQCAPQIKKAIVEVAEHGIYGYTYMHDEFYNSIINWNIRRHNSEIKKEWITLTHGTVSTLHYIIQEFCNKGDKVLLQSPAYDPFYNAVVRGGASPVYNRLLLNDGKYTIDYKDLEEKLSDEKTTFMILCSPHNPTGRVWTREELLKVGELCVRYNVLIVADEINRELMLYGNKHTAMIDVSEEIRNNTILCTSPNKAFNLGGLKSSYTVVPNEEIRNKLKKRLEKNSITSPNIFVIPSVTAAYNECEDWLEELIEYVEGNIDYLRNYLKTKIPSIKLVEPEGSYLAWLDFREVESDPVKLEEFNLNVAKIKFCEGYTFVENGDGFARINLGCQRFILEEALKRLEKAVNNR
ncbi:MAG: MalY/PatB family protein [Sarcina sp.]